MRGSADRSAWLLLVSVFAMAGDQTPAKSAEHPVVFVQPSDSWKVDSSIGGGGNVIIGTGHGGKEPQTAKIYQLLQHRTECVGVAPNMIEEKANYLMLVEHGGGKGNRWAVSNKDGEVIGSGETFALGNSVADACKAVMKDWNAHTAQK